MNASMMELKLNAIRYDVGLSRGEKIAKLEHLRNAACALRTAARKMRWRSNTAGARNCI